MKEIHDGLQVRKRLAELEMTMTTFAHKMDFSTSTGSRLLEKAHWDTAQLALASRILHRNFFTHHAWQVARTLSEDAHLLVSGAGKGRMLLFDETTELSPAEIIRLLFDHET